MKLVLTCEHASNRIPAPLKELFKGKEDILDSHHGFDPGAIELYKKLGPLAQKSFIYKWSRLVVEINRSIRHPQLFSEFTKPLAKNLKQDILQSYYFTYRNQVENHIKNILRTGAAVLHLSVHTFTSELSGKIRNADIGLLYDPARSSEKRFCRDFKDNLQREFPEFKIRFNYPYQGKADGFTTYLRQKFPDQYLGIEIELNQGVLQKKKFPKHIEKGIYTSLQKSLI